MGWGSGSARRGRIQTRAGGAVVKEAKNVWESVYGRLSWCRSSVSVEQCEEKEGREKRDEQPFGLSVRLEVGAPLEPRGPRPALPPTVRRQISRPSPSTARCAPKRARQRSEKVKGDSIFQHVGRTRPSSRGEGRRATIARCGLGNAHRRGGAGDGEWRVASRSEQTLGGLLGGVGPIHERLDAPDARLALLPGLGVLLRHLKRVELQRRKRTPSAYTLSHAYIHTTGLTRKEQCK